MESLFQLLDARWFCLLQLFPRTPQAISIVFNYDFDAFHLTTLLTITIEHLLLYSIVSSHTAKIQTSREYCNKWIRLQISFLLVHPIPLTTEEKTSFHMNFGHQQDHQPITCSAECFPTYQETPYIKREKIESVNIILKLQTRKENFQVRFQTDRASMGVYMRYGVDLGESSQNKSEKRHKAFYYSQRPVI